jgi:hypothetical protein
MPGAREKITSTCVAVCIHAIEGGFVCERVCAMGACLSVCALRALVQVSECNALLYVRMMT